MEIRELKQIERLNEIDVKICSRTYSDKILGYRIFLDNDAVIFLNNRFERNVMSDAFDRLMLLSERYIDYGFIMLLSNLELYYSPHHKFSESTGTYTLIPECEKEENVIMMDKTLIEVRKNKKIIDDLKRMNNIE